MAGPSPAGGDRLLARLAELARVGATPAGGVTRLAYSADDVAGRDLVASWMAAAGLEVTVDAAANLIGRVGGAAGPAVVLGSHLDTVVDGGPYDGAYGVVAGVEVVDAVVGQAREAGRPVPALAVVAFANEEGTRGTPGFAGSQACLGAPLPLERPSADGPVLGELIRRAGGDPEALAGAAWPAGSVAHYLELHIEQGPVLHATGVPIGLVTGITATQALDLHITGEANHAGTTPMDLRRDASVAAARLVLAANELAASGRVRVATTGVVEVGPGVRNVVPGRARLTVDLRDLDDARVHAAHAALLAEAERIGAATGTTVAVEAGIFRPAALCDERALGQVASVSAGLGLATERLPSGAGHDAQVIAALAPVTMIFVPSVGGISHSPLEHTEPHHLVAGAEVLAGTVRRLLGLPDPRRPI